MKNISKKGVVTIALVAFLIGSQTAYAEPLLYRGNRDNNQQNANVQNAQAPAIPIVTSCILTPSTIEPQARNATDLQDRQHRTA